MIDIQTNKIELTGTSYEIGWRLGKMVEKSEQLTQLYTTQMAGFEEEQYLEATELFDRWCPGLTEELCGFAEAVSIEPGQIVYYAMTYLLPRCSQIALLPEKTEEGKLLIARNYEFSHEAEDFCLIRTSVKGKYTHVGTGVLFFGRDEGMNEHGLSVTMSSCGFPVGALPFMRAPRLRGLQFWAVIRSLLENCRNVEEAVRHLSEMPIAYNLNLILADKSRKIVLYETLDGKHARKTVLPGSDEPYLYATNHAVLPELAELEPQAFKHSAVRYHYISRMLADSGKLTRTRLKQMLLNKFPEGLCCHYYEEFFGTTKSMILSPEDGTIEICWGGREENGWDIIRVDVPLQAETDTKQIVLEKADPEIYTYCDSLLHKK